MIIGLHPTKPPFMTRKRKRVEESPSSDSESDEDWRPRKKRKTQPATSSKYSRLMMNNLQQEAFLLTLSISLMTNPE